MNYKLKLEVFEGPLDLLLYLIKKNDLDVTNIPIAQVTEQYMQYIDMMKMLDLDVVGDFLVMAATLMQIKSQMLLPPDPSEEAEGVDPRDELAQRLLEYQKFKEIAEDLQMKEKFRKDLFQRMVDPEQLGQLRDESKELYFETSLFDLINAFTEALKRAPEEILHEIIKEEFTVEQKIHDILHLLLDKSSIQLSTLFRKSRNKVEIIATFLAILELIRLKEVKIVQKQLFGEIEILRNKDNIVPVEDDSASDENTSDEGSLEEQPPAEGVSEPNPN